jgi:hypothetical protein
MSDYQLMDVLGHAGGEAVDDLMREGVAPLDEISRDPHCKHPAGRRCKRDLGLASPGLAEEDAIFDMDGFIKGAFDVEKGIDEADSMVGEAIEEVDLL